jgi:hypothetical protein
MSLEAKVQGPKSKVQSFEFQAPVPAPTPERF